MSACPEAEFLVFAGDIIYELSIYLADENDCQIQILLASEFYCARLLCPVDLRLI